MPSEWFIKRFLKSKAIRAFVNYPDKRSRLHWCIPQEKTITIGGDTYSCNASKDYFTLVNGIPTFVYVKGKVEPLALDRENIFDSKMSSEEFNTAINQRIVKDIFASSEKAMDSNTLMIFGIIIIIAIIVGGGYFLYNTMNEMQMTINDLRETIRIISGQ